MRKSLINVNNKEPNMRNKIQIATLAIQVVNCVLLIALLAR